MEHGFDCNAKLHWKIVWVKVPKLLNERPRSVYAKPTSIPCTLYTTSWRDCNLEKSPRASSRWINRESVMARYRLDIQMQLYAAHVPSREHNRATNQTYSQTCGSEGLAHTVTQLTVVQKGSLRPFVHKPPMLRELDVIKVVVSRSLRSSDNSPQTPQIMNE